MTSKVQVNKKVLYKIRLQFNCSWKSTEKIKINNFFMWLYFFYLRSRLWHSKEVRVVPHYYINYSIFLWKSSIHTYIYILTIHFYQNLGSIHLHNIKIGQSETYKHIWHALPALEIKLGQIFMSNFWCQILALDTIQMKINTGLRLNKYHGTINTINLVPKSTKLELRVAGNR